MRTQLKLALLGILSLSVAGLPAMASPASAPLGAVIQADNAQVGQDITSGGATIYDGDNLKTTDGTLRVRLGGPQMFMRTNTLAQVHGLANGFSANLGAGTVVVSAVEGQTFQLIADGVTIRPIGKTGSVAEITRVNDKELLLSSSRGGIEVSMGDEVKTIEAGSSYRMEVMPEESGPGPQGGPLHTGHTHRLIFYTIVGVVAAGTAVVVWRALMSPSGF